MEQQLTEILRIPITDDIAPIRDVKNYYKACMNKELIEQRRAGPIFKVLNALGGWPVVVGPAWKSSSWTWQTASFEAFKKGFTQNYIIHIDVQPDDRNTSKRILSVSTYRFSSEPEFVLKFLK